MNTINQKEYLKKYLGIGKGSGDKKKKKKKDKIISTRMKIIDDDADYSISNEIQQDLNAEDEDAPQIVAVIDDRPPSLRIDEKTNSKLWQPLTPLEESARETQSSSNIKMTMRNRPNSPPSLMKHKLKNSNIKDVSSTKKIDKSSIERKNDDQSPIRVRKNYDSDNSPPRKSRNDSDNSPPRKRRDSDSSPPRKRRDFDNSPPRRKIRDDSPSLNNQNDSDKSPPRKSRNSDSSPPRKRRDSDNSPPRRRKNNDLSPTRHRNDSANSTVKKSKNSDSSPPRKRRNSDNSPPRKRKSLDPSKSNSDNNSSFRKNKNNEDLSPPRSSQRSSSPKRKSRWESDTKSPENKTKKTLEGKKAGLQNAEELARETASLRRREDELFKNLSEEVSGRNAETVVRHKKRKDPEVEALEKIREQENKEKYNKWGRGLKQVEELNEKVAQDLHEMSKPLARYADDEDLEKYLKEQEREGDPMLAYIRKKKHKKVVESGAPIRPTYQGEFMPNRFGIRPGYRWDGVDRSNGYEKKWFDVQNSRKAALEDSYKCSTEDM